MATRRFRLKFTFWLDVSKSDEYELAEQVEELKEQRLFSQTIRDGIRLICDLRAGRTDILLALFPWIASEFAPGVGEAELYQEIESLRELILHHNGRASLEPMPGSGFSQTTLEEETIALDVKAAAGGNAAQNFLSSVLSLQS
ncbi:MAG: hypothetical protein JRI35_09935 [Deltaproteobacteria bacterium]|nr:hypothetical protein [Deltaproteobacteria bacterium]